MIGIWATDLAPLAGPKIAKRSQFFGRKSNDVLPTNRAQPTAAMRGSPSSSASRCAAPTPAPGRTSSTKREIGARRRLRHHHRSTVRPLHASCVGWPIFCAFARPTLQARISSCLTVSRLSSIRISLLCRASTDLAMELTETLAINFGQKNPPSDMVERGIFVA